jgi:hypothetical protein
MTDFRQDDRIDFRQDDRIDFRQDDTICPPDENQEDKGFRSPLSEEVLWTKGGQNPASLSIILSKPHPDFIG